MRPYIAVPALLLAAAYGQEPAPSTDLVLRISVALVQVDAVVTDSKGHLVTDLESKDFEILQDGKPQKITNFSFIKTEPSVRPAVARPAPQPGVPGPPAPPVKLRPNQVRRTFALVVDDLGLGFESTARVRDALKRFVDQQIQPGDLVAIVRTGAGMGALQQFTSDKRMLYAAIERVRFNPFGRAGIGTFGAGDASESEVRADEFREEWFSVGTLGAINYIVRGLKELPGRKSVILFSENMRIFQSEGLNQNIMDSMRQLTDLANRASVVIYSIDPRGLQTLMPDASERMNDLNPQAMAEKMMKRHQDYFDSQDGMSYLAHETGGLFVSDNNDLNAGLRQVLDDQAGYYLIGYHPDPSTFDAATGRRKFHSVRVKVKRPGLSVRSRNGFFGVPEEAPRKQIFRTRDEQLFSALSSPFGESNLGIKLTTLFSNNAKTGSYIHSLLHIDGRDVSFQDDEQEGWKKAVMDVLVITFGDNGLEVDRSNRTFTIRLRGEALKNAMQNGFINSVNHPIKKPGAYQLRVAVRDAVTARVGSASQFIEVPDVKKGRLALSGLILKSWVTQAKPAADSPQEGHVEEPDPRGSPALRIFQPGKMLSYGYQVLNARGKQPSLESQLRLFRDGKQVYAGKPAAITGEGQADPKRLLAGGRLQLGGKMAPGDYVVQVVVTDKLAKDKYRTASQWIDFEVAR